MNLWAELAFEYGVDVEEAVVPCLVVRARFSEGVIGVDVAIPSQSETIAQSCEKHTVMCADRRTECARSLDSCRKIGDRVDGHMRQGDSSTCCHRRSIELRPRCGSVNVKGHEIVNVGIP